jgi:hypothetical protein
MARRTERVIYGVTGQSLLYRVPQGRPSAATFKVFADAAGDDGTEEFSGAATVDAVNTTVSSASGATEDDPRRINLASTASIVAGRKYRLSEGQLVEWAEVLSVGTGFVRVRDRLMNDYTTAAVFASTYLSASIDATWVADDANLSDLSDPNPDYRIRWLVTVGGADTLAYSYFDFVRAPYIHAIDLGDVGARFPGVAEILDAGDRLDQARSIIESAARVVRLELATLELSDAAILEDERLDEAVTLAALMVIAHGGTHPRQFTAMEYVQLKTDQFDRFIDKNFRASLKPPVAAGSDSAAERRAAAPFWEK